MSACQFSCVSRVLEVVIMNIVMETGDHVFLIW
jgi:hypothetical protein